MDAAKLDQLKDVLNRVWAEDTCYPGSWNKDIPCKGQCEPTACVVQDLFGGDIYKIVGDESIGAKGAHFFNVIDGKIAYGKGYQVEGLALRQLRTYSLFNRKQRYENLKRKIAAIMEYPLNAEGK